MARLLSYAHIILISSLSAGARLQAQDASLDRSAMPIDVVATPAKTLPQSPVTIRGTTGLVGEKSVVTIQVTLPGGKPASPIVVRPGTDGTYSTTFSQTKTSGKYQVAVTAPDGKGKATTTFDVVSATDFTADVASNMQALLDGSQKALAVARQRLEALPISPPRDQARSKLIAMEAEMKQSATRVGQFKKAMDDAFKARVKVVEAIPEWDQYLGELGMWDARAKAMQRRLEVENSTQAAEGCADLQVIADGMAMVSEALSVVQIPMDKSVSFWSDKVPAGLSTRALDPATTTNTERLVFVQALKLAVFAVQGPKGWLTYVAGLALDLGQYIVGETFDRYCVKFEGPLKGTFFGEALTRQGEKFWNYTISLNGKVVLMYPKGTSGSAVALKGYLEGTGQFTLRSNPEPINRLVPGVVLFHKAVSMPSLTYQPELGMGMGGFGPHAFRVPVTGVLAGDSIVLTVQPATFDFGDVMSGHLVWVIMPLGGMWPEVIKAPVQYQKAHPIFERVIRRKPVMKISKEGSYMVARGSFARDTTNADRTAHVTTELNLKACNPGCAPVPFNPQSKKAP